MSVRGVTWVVAALALCLLPLAVAPASPQEEGGQVSFPRYVPKEEGSPYDRPLWIDASELFTSWGTFRRAEDAGKMPGPEGMLWRLDQARAAGTYRDGEGCFEDGPASIGPRSEGPPIPNNMTDLEVLAEAIILGRVVGMKPGFLRGRGVGLYGVEVLEVLKGADAVGNESSVFVFWPETRFDFDSFCVDWSIGGWWPPPPEVGREILLTPVRGVLQTIAGHPAIIVYDGAEAIYETETGLSAPLSPDRFPEVFSGVSIRELGLVRRLREGRQR